MPFKHFEKESFKVPGMGVFLLFKEPLVGKLLVPMVYFDFRCLVGIIAKSMDPVPIGIS